MKAKTESRYRAAVDRAAGWIEKHSAEPLRLPDAAEVACMSDFHFQRVFTAMIGETPGDYLRRRRVERSLHLLGATTYSVQAVASLVGFESASVLCHVMGRSLGTSPGAFRRFDKAESLGAILAKAHKVRPPKVHVDDKPIAIVDLPERHALLHVVSGLKERSFVAISDAACMTLAQTYRQLWPDLPIGPLFAFCPDETLAADDPTERFVPGIIAPTSIAPPISNPVFRFDKLPGGWHAVFEQRGDYQFHWQMWNRIGRQALRINRLYRRSAPAFEAQIDDPLTTGVDHLRTYLYVPIHPVGATARQIAVRNEQDQDALRFLRPMQGNLFRRLQTIARQAVV